MVPCLILIVSFEFRTLRKVIVDIPSKEPLWFEAGQTLGHIYSCEIVAVSPKYLRIEWLLDSGGTIVIEFEKLLYRSKSFEIAPPKNFSQQKQSRIHKTKN
jgi:hypothetical protein